MHRVTTNLKNLKCTTPHVEIHKHYLEHGGGGALLGALASRAPRQALLFDDARVRRCLFGLGELRAHRPQLRLELRDSGGRCHGRRGRRRRCRRRRCSCELTAQCAQLLVLLLCERGGRLILLRAFALRVNRGAQRVGVGARIVGLTLEARAFHVGALGSRGGGGGRCIRTCSGGAHLRLECGALAGVQRLGGVELSLRIGSVALGGRLGGDQCARL